MRFVSDASCKFAQFKTSGKVCEIRIASGLSKESRSVVPSMSIQHIDIRLLKLNQHKNRINQPLENENRLNQSNLQSNSYQTMPSRPPPLQSHTLQIQKPPPFQTQSSEIQRPLQLQTQTSGIQRPPPPAIKKKPPPIPAKKVSLPTVKALYDYTAQEADELTFKENDIITLISKKEDGWWTGTLDGKKGVFPANVIIHTYIIWIHIIVY